MKEIKGNLELKKDTIFEESITVEGNITGKYNLRVIGNINAGDIDAWDIDAWDIDAGNINSGNINAGDIDAWDINAGDINAGNINSGNINAGDIICEKRTKKTKNAKTIARILIQEKSKLKREEKMGK